MLVEGPTTQHGDQPRRRRAGRGWRRPEEGDTSRASGVLWARWVRGTSWLRRGPLRRIFPSGNFSPVGARPRRFVFLRSGPPSLLLTHDTESRVCRGRARGAKARSVTAPPTHTPGVWRGAVLGTDTQSFALTTRVAPASCGLPATSGFLRRVVATRLVSAGSRRYGGGRFCLLFVGES